MHDLQKASMWKRASAWLFDLIVFATVITIVVIPLSILLKYDEKVDTVDKIEEKYRDMLIMDGLDPDISSSDFDALPKEVQDRYREIDDLRAKDEGLGIGYAIITNIITALVFVSIFITYMILEFVLPMCLKNGQTIGKKIFGIGVVHSNCVRFGGQSCFIRAMIGKCAIETMVPVFLVMMILFGNLGLTGAIVLILLAILQIYAICSSKTRSAIHDLISDAVVVDLASQMIFEDHDQLMAYKNKVHSEAVEKADY